MTLLPPKMATEPCLVRDHFMLASSPFQDWPVSVDRDSVLLKEGDLGIIGREQNHVNNGNRNDSDNKATGNDNFGNGNV